MNAPEPPTRSLPGYGLRDDEMTRPGVVLFDWDGDDEATVRVDAPSLAATAEPDVDEDDDFDASQFRPHWHGIGRRPGTVALTVVLGVSVAIGICALLLPDEVQGTTVSAR